MLKYLLKTSGNLLEFCFHDLLVTLRQHGCGIMLLKMDSRVIPKNSTRFYCAWNRDSQIVNF